MGGGWRVEPRDEGGRRWALRVAAGAMALTMLPYLYGLLLQGAGPGRAWYAWLGYNLDDSAVYLAWMRQAADGSFFQRNLFTTEPQAGQQFNLFFLALGNLGRLGLPLLFVYHAARLVLGIVFLRSVWWLLELVAADAGVRRKAFLLVCFSAGLGWLPGLWRESGILSPVDVWQPEAVTFLCLYLSPLFLVSLLLMVGVIGWLLIAARTGDWAAALKAGLCGLLLGNIHTYDVLTLSAIWIVYLGARWVSMRRWEPRLLLQSLTAGAMAAVSAGHMYYLLRTEEVFARRAAVETLSGSLSLVLLGYGLLLPLALLGVARGRRGEPHMRPLHGDGLLLLAVWAVANAAIAYAPVPFQRKMLMGTHIPIAILAGAGLHALLAGLPGGGRRAALAGAVALLGLTNLRFMARDMANFQQNLGQSRIQRPYMYGGEVRALAWLRENTSPGEAIQPLPWIMVGEDGRVGFVDTTAACFAPGLAGRPVNAGHWGETPDFQRTMGRWREFLLPTTSDDARRALLRQTGVKYLLFSQVPEETRNARTTDVLRWIWETPPAYLVRVAEASSAEAIVLRVASP